ncbi:vWA domain-containing protein [Naumannella halotolerans]|uniref:Secreted protein with Ig-like and vWFA domain n=1 Tax=Naumannella halotolerans TaxID=993414 RepID=A0A4R7J8A9_9ACTN|nr:VWA domain-containing protein [Naumannella halotolerans]TDT33720.1 secreted protein with Ig-like and vWFA domain [Naumannella halotolerans]
MTEFTAAVYQNEFLPAGGTDVHAIVNLSCTGAGQAGAGGGAAGEIIAVDTSGSMGSANMELAKRAAVAAVENIHDGTWFAVVAGNHRAFLAYPRNPGAVGMVQMTPQTRFEAINAIATFRAQGGTAIGSWLNLTRALFDSVPNLPQRHAIILTDGENHNETPAQLDEAINACLGSFQADCRGVGTDWKVSEVRRISQALLGTVDIIPRPEDMPRVFAELVQQSMSRGVADAALRVWTPQGAQVLFCRQVLPQVEDLTGRASQVNPLTVDYPTGSWSDESRDYHVAVRLAARELGQEQLAARVQIVVGEQTMAQGLVKARWSDDDSLTARIDPAVAHYTGQTELADAIQQGLAAKAAGRTDEATTRLGRAVQLAAATGNEEATSRLRKVVDIDDPETGTVRLKASVDKADEMALDTASTKTTRIRG